jgi:cell division protein FtsN
MAHRPITVPLLLTCLFLFAGHALAQMAERDIRQRLDLVYGGYAEKVREELPILMKQHPGDAGVLYLDAVLTSDGMQASKKYQLIADKYPQSEWADDALYKIHQYYYSIGLYKTADQKLEQLKEKYPNSIYVTESVSVPVAESKPAVVETPIVSDRQEESKPADQVVTSPPPPGKTLFAPGRKFGVQAGAFATKDNADKQAAFFKSIGKEAVVTEKETGGKTLYVVSLEGGMSELDARDLIAELKTKYNIESIIVAR